MGNATRTAAMTGAPADGATQGQPGTSQAGLGRPERRKNIDRSNTTRRQILEATITCLDKWGYGAVTNIKVADEAGVSRGAMMHHFPTRQALIVATLRYAYDRLCEYRQGELEKFPPGLERFRQIIELAFTTARQREGIACNEIRTGSRSDPEIREAVTPLMSHISEDYARMVSRVGREAGLKPTREFHGLTGTVAMSTRGLSVNTFTYPSPQTAENVLWMLSAMREDLIARQLGEAFAKRPAPLPETRSAKR